MISEVFETWKKQPLQLLSTLGVLTGILSVCFTFVLVQTNLNEVLSQWGSDFKLNIYLSDTATEADRSAISQRVVQSQLFSQSRFVSKEQALESFRSRLGFLGQDLVQEGSLENPLPSSFEATINTGLANFIGRLEVFSKEILNLSFIEDVSYGQNWVENYAQVIGVWNSISLFVGFILLSGALLLAAGIIRSSIFLRHDEIEILELFGATKWMIAKPFIVEGAILGFFAGILSVLSVFLVYQITLSFMSSQIAMWNLTEIVSFSNAFVNTVFVLTCTVLGAAGSLISVRRINTGWAAAEKG